jgi:hypothetical protein
LSERLASAFKRMQDRELAQFVLGVCGLDPGSRYKDAREPAKMICCPLGGLGDGWHVQASAEML